MGRSVSYASNSVHVAYAATEIEDGDDWGYHCEDFQREMRKALPSLSECDEWVGREDRALLENSHCYIGVSEYCGLVSMWVQPKEPDYYGQDTTGLRDRWIDQIGPRFRKVASSCFGQALIKQGTFSNGEGFFAPINGQQQGALSLGYSSKEGWL